MKICRMILLSCCALLLNISSALAQPVTISRDVELRSEPVMASPAVFSVKRDDKAEVLVKHGPWLRVRADGRESWLLSTSITYGPASGAHMDTRIGIRRTTIPMADKAAQHQILRQRGEEQLKLLDEYARQYDEELARANSVE